MSSGCFGEKGCIVCPLESEEFGGVDRLFTFSSKIQSYHGK